MLVVLACEHGTGDPMVEPSAAAAPTSTPSTTPAPPVTPAQPSAVPAPPKANSHAKVPADAPRFVKVAATAANSAGELRLFAIEGGAFLGVGPALLRLHPDGTIEHERQWARGLDGGRIELDAVTAGMNWFDTEALGGSWPEDTILAIRPQSGSRGIDDAPLVYRRSNAVWTQIATRERLYDWYPRAFGRWKSGSLLALKAFAPRYAHPGDEEDGPPAREVAASARAIAKQKRLVVLRGTPKAPAFGARSVQGFASFPDGEIVAAIANGDRVVMLHHDETGAHDRELAPPGRGLLATSPIELRARAPDDVWVLGEAPWRNDDTPATPGDGAYLAHFDGRAWSEIPTECDRDPRGLAIDRAGSAYFLCNLRITSDEQPTVLFRVRAGVLEELPLPVVPTAVLPLAEDDIWLVHDPNGTAELLHTSATPRQQHIPTAIQAAHEVLEFAEPRALDKSCQTAWIPLAADTDRAKVTAALDQINSATEVGMAAELVDARVHGEVRLGVIVRLFGAAVLRETARVRARLGDAAGPATCNEYPPLEGDSHD